MKQPGLMPPTVAGPMMVTFLALASALTRRVLNSGMPSAIIAIVRNCGNLSVCSVASSADHERETKGHLRWFEKVEIC